MPSNPTRSDLSYWNKKLIISDSRHVTSQYGPIQIGKNNYYGPKITRLGKAEIVYKKIIPVLFVSIVLAPLAIPYIFAFTDLYRHVGRWVREVHYGRRLECINNIAGQALSSKSSQSKSTSDTKNGCVHLDSNNVPLEVLDLVFSSIPYFKNDDEVKKYFDTLSVVCKSWNSRVEKAKLNILNAGKRSLHDLPRMDTKEAALSYIKANADQLVTLDLSLYKMTNDDMPNILICKNLESLTIQGKNIGNDINLFTKLKKLTISNSSNLDIDVFNFPYLEELNIINNEVDKIPRFGHLPKLKKLNICSNKFLMEIPSLDSLIRLKHLWISNNSLLIKIPSSENLPMLKKISIDLDTQMRIELYQTFSQFFN